MATAWKLTMNLAASNRVALAAATALVTDVTRQVFNQAIIDTPVDTGLLRASNQMRVLARGTSVTGEVYNDLDYAAAVHDGTKAHTVVPRSKKVLRFVIDGEVVFARRARIPARAGRPWLRNAMIKRAGPAGFIIGAP